MLQTTEMNAAPQAVAAAEADADPVAEMYKAPVLKVSWADVIDILQEANTVDQRLQKDQHGSVDIESDHESSANKSSTSIAECARRAAVEAGLPQEPEAAGEARLQQHPNDSDDDSSR